MLSMKTIIATKIPLKPIENEDNGTIPNLKKLKKESVMKDTWYDVILMV